MTVNGAIFGGARGGRGVTERELTEIKYRQK